MCYPFKCDDNSFDDIFSEHVLEHFYVDDAKNILKECYRILKPQCYIQLSIPDLHLCIQEYLQLKANKATPILVLRELGFLRKNFCT